MRPVRYRHNGLGETADNGQEFVGLIAQKAREVAPYMISEVARKLRKTDKETTQILQMDPTAITYMLINAVQELADENDRLRAKLAEAEAALADAREAAEQASAAKTRLLANVSHELRTPLNGVLALADLLLATEPEGEREQHLRRLRGPAVQLRGLVQDLLDVGALDAGGLDLDIAPFDLRALLDELRELFATRCRVKGLALSIDVDAAVAASVAGDARRLHQILTNLLANAVRHTRSGHVLVRVRPVGAQLSIEVEDSGEGIPEYEQARIFEAFCRLDERPGGVGLGLAISRALAERMGGTLTVSASRARARRSACAATCRPPRRPPSRPPT